MRAIGQRDGRGASPDGRTGFTLVELLLVMFVLAVLVALVVGVGSYVIDEGRKAETLAKMNLLMAAIRTYHDVTETFPAHIDPNNPNDPNYSIQALVDCLEGRFVDNRLAAEERKKRANAIRRVTRPFVDRIVGGSKVDAFESMMRYYPDRGAGGRPLILSAGPDGDFGDRRQDRREDNIRSDMQK